MKQYRARKIKIAAGAETSRCWFCNPCSRHFAKHRALCGCMAAVMRLACRRWFICPGRFRWWSGVVVSPRYRLAARHPYPAALEDCYAALQYLKAHAEELGCASNQIMVGGESAGGGLAAALCMLARDRGEVRIAFQMPLYPMLDNRDTDSSRHNHGISWGTWRNHAVWRLYLRKVRSAIPAYAVPARQTDYRDLPPAYTFVGAREPFYCEILDYIANLRGAGVSAWVDVYPTGFHAFDMLLPFRKISRQAAAELERRYLYAAAHCFAPQDGE